MNAKLNGSKAGVATLVALLAVSPLEAEETEQVIRAVEGYTLGSAERGTATLSQLKEQRTAAADVVSKPRSASFSPTLGDQWIYEADVVLYDDFDADGYYRFLSVRFDADTYLYDSWVYAMLYLSADGQTWTHFYTTEDFLIGGTVPDDEYYVETELLAGYPPGLYDVLIELYDADFGTFADEYGPNESSAMGLLPVEDASFDAPPVQVSISSGHGGGGAMGLGLLPALIAALWTRRRAILTAVTKGLYSAHFDAQPSTRAHR